MKGSLTEFRGGLRKAPIGGWPGIHATARQWKLDVNIGIERPRRLIPKVDHRIEESSSDSIRATGLGARREFSREVDFQARSS